MPDQRTISVDRPEEGDKLTQSQEQVSEAINTALVMLNSQLSTKFGEYASHRYTKEKEWIQAEQQYAGILDVEDDKKLRAVSSRATGGSPPVVNITRQKTNIATARMQDIQFPLGGNYNFIIEPTEVPELQRALEDDTPIEQPPEPCLLYTSDAADDLLQV